MAILQHNFKMHLIFYRYVVQSSPRFLVKLEKKAYQMIWWHITDPNQLVLAGDDFSRFGTDD